MPYYRLSICSPNSSQGDNWAAIGFDLNSEAERNKAFNNAIATKDCSTTGIIYLVQVRGRRSAVHRRAEKNSRTKRPRG